MEFSRRGPATDVAADGHRCPDPPPHGDPILVMSDALLWQLQKNRLRQEIIVAELAKIERARALRAVPMPRHGMPQCRGPVSCWDYCGDVGEELHDVKLPDNDGQQSAESRSWKPVMEDHVDGCWNPCKCRGKVGQQNTELDEPKLQDSSETVPPNKKSLAMKWELTGTTILVKKPKPLMKWSCAVCQVQASREQDLQMHYAGKKHKSIMAILESKIMAIRGQKAGTTAELSPGTDQIKTLSIKWSCSTCQANGTCQSDLEEHLKGTTPQQNITFSIKKGRNNDMAKNMALHEAKSHESNVSQHAEMPPSLGSCNIWQTICCCESDLEIRALTEQSKNMATNSEPQKENMDPNGVPRHSEKTNGELDLERHLRDDRHQLNVQALRKNINQEKNNLQQIAKDQEMCEAKCNSEPQFEHHCKGRNRNQKSGVILGEGDIAKMSSAHIETSCREGSNIDLAKNIVSQEANPHDSNEPEHAEKPPSERSCSTCQGICNCKSDQDISLAFRNFAKKYRKMALDSKTLKAKLIRDGVPPHAEKSNCELSLESHLREERNQLNVQALREKINQEKNNLPQIAKDQEPPPEVECDVCEAKCNSESQFEHDCKSRNHQQKFNVMLGEDNIVKVSSLHTESTCKEDTNKGTSKGIVSLEAKCQESDVPEHAEKTPSVRSCSICQGICNCESDLEIRAMAMDKLYMKLRNSESRKAKLIPNGVPKHAKKMHAELDLERHQLNVQALREKINQENNKLPQIAKDQELPSEVECAVCEAKCNPELQFDHHCKSRKHLQKFNAILSEGNIVKVDSLHIESTCKEGSNNDMSKDIVSLEAKCQESDVPEHAEKTPSVRSCSICQGICNCESDLAIRAIIKKDKIMEVDSELLKETLVPNGVPQHAEKMNGELDLENHQLNVEGLCDKNIQQRSNPPETAKGQISSSEWHCAMCQAKCHSKAQLETHCTGKKHQRKMKVAKATPYK